MPAKRMEWIDISKGIGIILVVASHVFGGAVSRYSAWFFMPLFFFISGFLYKGPTPVRPFLKKRVQHLLVPYFSFIIFIGILTYLSYIFLTTAPNTSIRYAAEYVWRLLYGGRALGSVFKYLGLPFGICWFLTCLFLTQLLYNEIQKRLGFSRILVFIVIVGMYILAIADSQTKFMTGAFNNWGLPWNINVVPFAIVFFYIGHQTARFTRSSMYQRYSVRFDTFVFVFAVSYLFVALVLNNAGILQPRMSVKFAKYGIPVYSLFLSIALITLTNWTAKAWSRCQEPVKFIIMECGKASMVIMYVHSYVQFIMKDYAPTAFPMMRFVFSIALSYCLYRIFLLFPLTRKIFLGDFRSDSSRF